MAKKKFLKENNEQIWPITRMDCIYTMDGTQLLPDALDKEFEEIDNAIDKINEELGSVLLKTEQELTDEEKDQVRENLGYIGKAATVGEKVTVDGKEYTVENNAEIFGDYDTNKAIGAWSIAEGSENVAVGKVSHVEGAMNKAIGMGSHVEGVQCTATGYWSHAEGERTQVTSYASHAEGSYTNLPDGTVSYGTASGYASHVEGGGCHTTGSCSHAEGLGSRANGYYSHAEGSFTVANGKAQHVEGIANIEDNENKYIHIAGNGSWENGQADPVRSNAHTLDWNGNAWFAGNVSIGTDNKQLATEEFVNDAIDNIPEGFSGDYNDLINKPEIPSIEGLATKEFVDNAIMELREEMVILDEDDLTMDGLIDDTFPSLTTNNKTLIGAINELNNKIQDAPSGGNTPSEGVETEIEKSVIDEMLMDILGITVGEGE